MSPLTSIKKALKTIKGRVQATISSKPKTTTPPTVKSFIGGAKLTGDIPPPDETRPLMSADGNYPVNAEGFRTSKFTECMIWEPQPRKYRIDSAVDLLQSLVAEEQEGQEVASVASSVRNECEMRRLGQDFWEFNESASEQDLSSEASFEMEMREGARLWWL